MWHPLKKKSEIQWVGNEKAYIVSFPCLDLSFILSNSCSHTFYLFVSRTWSLSLTLSRSLSLSLTLSHSISLFYFQQWSHESLLILSEFYLTNGEAQRNWVVSWLLTTQTTHSTISLLCGYRVPFAWHLRKKTSRANISWAVILY